MERDLVTMLANILDCGTEEINLLRKTKIDLCDIVADIKSEGRILDLENIMRTAFEHEISKLSHLEGFDTSDFLFEFNYCASDMYIRESKAEYYRKEASEILGEIEDVLCENFQEGEW